MRQYACVCATACIVLGSLCGTTSANSEIPPGFKNPKLERSALSSVGRLWKSESTRTLLAGLALTRIAHHYDGPAGRDAARSWAETVDIGDSYGNGLYLGALTATVWGYGALTGHADARQTGGSMMKGLILDAIVVNSLKSAVGRTRPDGTDARSFPSGHTTAAFTISTVLYRRHGWKIGVPALGLAAFTAIARMEDKRHYLSDVVAGATIGIAIGQLVSPKDRDKVGGLQVVAAPTKVGLRLKF